MQRAELSGYIPSPTAPLGVIVGCDRHQEWILPWWWSHFSAFNSLPVLFVDFGMSIEASEWCSQRGKCPFSQEPPPLRFSPKARFPQKWSNLGKPDLGGGFGQPALAGLKNLLRFLHSPFKKNLWLDFDCEVRGDLSPLFSRFQGEYVSPKSLSMPKIIWGCSAFGKQRRGFSTQGLSYFSRRPPNFRLGKTIF